MILNFNNDLYIYNNSLLETPKIVYDYFENKKVLNLRVES